MKKTPVNVSPALGQAVDDMRAKALPQLVGLVIRFNEDDRTIGQTQRASGCSAQLN